MKRNEQPNMVKVLARRKMPKNCVQPKPLYTDGLTNRERMMERAVERSEFVTLPSPYVRRQKVGI